MCPSSPPLGRPGLGSAFELRRAFCYVIFQHALQAAARFGFLSFLSCGAMSRAHAIMSFGSAPIVAMEAGADYGEILDACGTKEGDGAAIDLARVGLLLLQRKKKGNKNTFENNTQEQNKSACGVRTGLKQFKKRIRNNSADSKPIPSRFLTATELKPERLRPERAFFHGSREPNRNRKP